MSTEVVLRPLGSMRSPVALLLGPPGIAPGTLCIHQVLKTAFLSVAGSFPWEPEEEGAGVSRHFRFEGNLSIWGPRREKYVRTAEVMSGQKAFWEFY